MNKIVFEFPVWLKEFAEILQNPLLRVEERMGFVVGLARENVKRGTGGPFGAGVFDRESGRLVSCGVNLVTWANCSLLHAEMVAILLGQNKFGTYDLGAADLPELELVSSTEPCAMCLGAIPWSGIKHLVTGATDADARKIGFDEGAKPADWVGSLESRGITVKREVLRAEAREVLTEYHRTGGIIY